MRPTRALMFALSAELVALGCSGGGPPAAKTDSPGRSQNEFPCVLPEGFSLISTPKMGPLTPDDQDALVAVWKQIVLHHELYRFEGHVDKVVMTLRTHSRHPIVPDSAFVARVNTDSTRVLTTPEDKWRDVWVELFLWGWAGPDTAYVESTVWRGMMMPSTISYYSIAVRRPAGWRACMKPIIGIGN